MQKFPFLASRQAWLVAALGLVIGAAMLPIAPLTNPVQAQSLDLDAIFNCSADGPLGEQTPEQCLASRDTLLSTCTTCHTFVPIVKAQKAPDLWDATLAVHRTRVPDMSDDAFEQLRLFLKAHFNDTEPAPTLPPELEALGTGLPF